MITNLVTIMTAALITMNIAGIHYTSYWSIAGMFFGWMVINGMVTAIGIRAQQEQMAAVRLEAEEAAKQEFGRAIDEALAEAEREEKSDKELH